MSTTIGMGAEKKTTKNTDAKLKKENKELTAKIAELEVENKELTARIAELEEIQEKDRK